MKKLVISVFIFVALVAAFICGCNDESAALKQRIDSLEEKVADLENDNERLLEMLYGLGFQDGEFYSLQQAYDADWLSKEDLKSIAYYHNGGTEGNEEVMDADFETQPKTPEVIDKVTELSIKQTYIYSNKLGGYGKPSGVTVKNYYGSYNNCYAVVLDSKYISYPADVIDEWKMIDGVNIHYTDYLEIDIWKANGD